MKIKYINSKIFEKFIAFTLVVTLNAPMAVGSANVSDSTSHDAVNNLDDKSNVQIEENQTGSYKLESDARLIEEMVSTYRIENSSYWWPIGSEETVEVEESVLAKDIPYKSSITSNYGYRVHPISGTTRFHSGVDISSSAGNGVVNIIAAKDGVVVYPTADSNNNGGYGNYVILQHNDGNFTLYAHLHPNTITVIEGDVVKQGQIIGKMGNTGYSTGTHLHFEVRVGENDSSATANPLEYISIDNPRNVTMDVICLNNCEGHTKEVNGSYVVEYCNASEELLEQDTPKIKIK